MSSQESTSPVYRYAIFAAVVLFASIFAIVYFRSRFEQQRQHRARALLGVGDLAVLEQMKPPLFDAYLSAGLQIRDAEAHQWAEMMPLSASNLSSESFPPTMKGDADSRADQVRVLVSVVVRMPAPPFNAPDPTSEEADLEVPYVELGFSEVEVLQPRGEVKSVPL
ncbi:hypothetical protein B0H11DRAFT_1177452 [Mycena galericulata]|nr:hypothetical protein B0H11DRAFT_1177452 [Mycena galericulata]